MINSGGIEITHWSRQQAFEEFKLEEIALTNTIYGIDIYTAITYPQYVVSIKKAFLTNTEGRGIQVTKVQKVSIQESSVNVVKQCGDSPCGVRMKWVKDFLSSM